MTRKAKGAERRANTLHASRPSPHASRPTPHATLDFHADLFARVFGEPFTARIKDRLRLRAVQRQIEDADPGIDVGRGIREGVDAGDLRAQAERKSAIGTLPGIGRRDLAARKLCRQIVELVAQPDEDRKSVV